MTGAILTGARVIRADLRGVHLESARMVEVRIEETTFSNGNLRAVSLLQSRCAHVDFSFCDLEGCDLRSGRYRAAKFVGAVMTGSKLSDAKFEASEFRKADLAFSILARTEFPNANCYQSNWNGCDLRDSNLSGCDFTGASLTGTRLHGAKLQGADLRGANLHNALGLTARQLGQARTDDKTVLPNGKKGPYSRNSGAERPANVH